MLTWIVLAQLAVSDSTYSTEALRRFVAEAAARNRQVPASLQSYRATAESEIAIVARRADGTEGTISVEQVHNEVRWRRPGHFEQHVIGYRSQSLGFQFASLSFLRQPWTIPILYGNRMSVLLGRDTSRAALRRAERRQVTAVHPLADDRDRVYRFSGGDTVITMRVGDRELPIVRVTVSPRPDAPPRTVAFNGELDLDATRHALVRMRGHFVSIAPRRSLTERVLIAGGLEAIAFVELENGEFEGQYWLPTYQRFEAQVGFSSTTTARSIFRIISRYRQLQVNDTVVTAAVDTLVPMPYTLNVASGDTLSSFDAWRSDLGTLGRDARADDFDDIAPDGWRATGTPLTRFRVGRLTDAVHLNRIEGLYTGWGVERRFRDQWPGVVVIGTAGWAWSEGTVRGRVAAEWMRGRSRWGVRAGRALDLTNDFRTAFDSGSVIGPLFSLDNYDYVDRRLAALSLVRTLDRAQSVVRLESGPASDAYAARTLRRGVFRGDSLFRENRGVREGSYWRSLASLEWHPDVSAEFMRTGVGGQVTLEQGTGDLDYTRIDARLSARKNRGLATIAGRLDGGAVLGDEPPPQQLYEIGSTQGLQGYDYKAFTGNRAAVARTLAMVRLPVWQSPVRVGRWFLPGLSPALSVAAQAAWSELHGAGATRANVELWDPVRPATAGVRSSVTLGVRVFGGAIGVGMARALDRRDTWRLRVDFGQLL